jgi:N-acetylmuramoyl-L-alanine amidase
LNGTSVYYDHDNSIALAEAVHQELLAALGTTNKGVRNANFAVIRKTKGKGILVETAFINHQGDREKLTNGNFQERAARAIVQGLINAFSRDTSLEAPTP